MANGLDLEVIELTLDQLLNTKREDFKEGNYSLLLSKSKAQELGFNLTSFLVDGENIIINCFFQARDGRFIVSDKDGIRSRDLSLLLNTIYDEKQPRAVVPPPAPSNDFNSPTKEGPKEEPKPKEEPTKGPKEEPKPKEEPTKGPKEEPKPKEEEEVEDEDSPLSVCDRKLSLQDFIITPIENLSSGQLLCIEDRNDDFQMIPDSMQDNFIFYKGKVYFYVMLDITKVGAEVKSFKLAVIQEDGSVNIQISQNLTNFYKEFQENFRKAKRKGIKPVVQEPTTKKGVRIELTKRIYEKDDTDEIKALRNRLYDAIDNLKRLQADILPIDLDLKVEDNYIPLTLADPNFFENMETHKLSIIHIIPPDLFTRKGEIYYIHKDILQFAKQILDKKDRIKDYDPTYVIKDDFDRQMILMEQIRRNFFDINLKKIKEKYLDHKNSVAIVKLNELRSENKLLNNDLLKELIRTKYTTTEDVKEKEIYNIIFNNFDTWISSSDTLKDKLKQSPLTEDEIYLLEHDDERIAEEKDMNKPDSAYPISFPQEMHEEFQMGNILFLDGKMMRPHYHKFINNEGKKTTKASIQELHDHGEFLSPEGLADVILNQEIIRPFKCFRSEGTEIYNLGCKRVYTLYQIWRCLRDIRKELYKIQQTKLREEFYKVLILQPYINIKSEGKKILEKKFNNEINNLQENINIAIQTKKAKDDFERQILDRVNIELIKQQKKYSDFLEKKGYIRSVETFFSEHTKFQPNNSSIFCPYCSEWIEERGAEDGCRFYYKEDQERKQHFHHLIDGKLPVGHNYRNKRTDICGVCNGPVAGHAHFLLDVENPIVKGFEATDAPPHPGDENLCVRDNNRIKGGNLDRTCLLTGGGGILEGIARNLAFRDVIKMKITTSPPSHKFGIKHEELAVLADIYARIIRINLTRPGQIKNERAFRTEPNLPRIMDNDKNKLLALPMPESIKDLVRHAITKIEDGSIKEWAVNTRYPPNSYIINNNNIFFSKTGSAGTAKFNEDNMWTLVRINVFERVNTIYDNRQWEEGPNPRDLLIIPPVNEPNRAEIEARVRREIGSGQKNAPKPPPKNAPPPPPTKNAPKPPSKNVPPPPVTKKTREQLILEINQIITRIQELESRGNSEDVVNEIINLTTSLSILQRELQGLAPEGGSSNKVTSARRTLKRRKLQKKKTRAHL
jgi:hypothetical protein